MIASPKLFRYICRTYLLNFLVLMLVLLGIVYVFDCIELLRRTSTLSGVSLGQILKMGAFKLPKVGQVMLPFGVLFAAIYSCWRLNKTNELIVIRAAGLSAWQFLMPMLSTAVALGILATMLINPVSAFLISRYNELDSAITQQDDSLLTISRTGIWLRQQMSGEEVANVQQGRDAAAANAAPALAEKEKDPAEKIPVVPGNGYAFIHAEGFDEKQWRLSDVIVFVFNAKDDMVARLDSPVAYLRNGYWELRDARADTVKGMIGYDIKNIGTSLTASRIEESFADPETISFWQIPEYIEIMEETGFPPTRLQIQLQNLLAQPILFAAMVLLAATFSLRPPRFGGTSLMITLGVLAGFFIFFMESMLQAFGISQKIPVVLAAWTPAVVSLLLGMTALLYAEDG